MIKIFDNVYCIDKALFLKKQKVLVIADLQIGQESYLANSGIFIPQFQKNEMIKNINILINKNKTKIFYSSETGMVRGFSFYY